MRALLLILLFTVLVSETCEEKKARKKAASETAVPESEDMNKIPVCIQVKIDSIKKLPRFNPPAEVSEYIFNDKRVFLFSADCCDFFNLLIDENCKYICAPTGGITGQGDFKCTDFTKNAKLIKLVWKDERK